MLLIGGQSTGVYRTSGNFINIEANSKSMEHSESRSCTWNINKFRLWPADIFNGHIVLGTEGVLKLRNSNILGNLET